MHYRLPGACTGNNWCICFFGSGMAEYDAQIVERVFNSDSNLLFEKPVNPSWSSDVPPKLRRALPTSVHTMHCQPNPEPCRTRKKVDAEWDNWCPLVGADQWQAQCPSSCNWRSNLRSVSPQTFCRQSMAEPSRPMYRIARLLLVPLEPDVMLALPTPQNTQTHTFIHSCPTASFVSKSLAKGSCQTTLELRSPAGT